MTILSKGMEKAPSKQAIKDYVAFKGFVTRSKIPALIGALADDKRNESSLKKLRQHAKHNR